MLSQIRLVLIAIIILTVMFIAALLLDNVVPKENTTKYGYGILALGILIGVVYTAFNHFNNIRKGASLLFSKPKPVETQPYINYNRNRKYSY